MKKVVIYTDGACSGNPGVGGWAAILIFNGVEKEISGYDKQTTNNRMELFAVIQALRALKESCEVEIYTDSAYVADAFLKNWITSWEKNNWKTSGKSDVKNVDLWKNRIMHHNRVSKSMKSVILSSNIIKKQLGIPLSNEELNIELKFSKEL